VALKPHQALNLVQLMALKPLLALNLDLDLRLARVAVALKQPQVPNLVQ